MWVDIANLMGPKGADGVDGQRGEPGPINIGLNPDEPLRWDQAGGFTFQFVDGSEQTVNLPIASAQSAGLLAAGGLQQSTGVREINDLVSTGEVVSGRLMVSRTGNIVVVSTHELVLSATGWNALCNLPAGFSSVSRIETYWHDNDYRERQAILTSKRIDLSFPPEQQIVRGAYIYPTNDPWPSALPGRAI